MRGGFGILGWYSALFGLHYWPLLCGSGEVVVKVQLGAHRCRASLCADLFYTLTDSLR
jgi:hypothetical protein